MAVTKEAAAVAAGAGTGAGAGAGMAVTMAVPAATASTATISASDANSERKGSPWGVEDGGGGRDSRNTSTSTAGNSSGTNGTSTTGHCSDGGNSMSLAAGHVLADEFPQIRWGMIDGTNGGRGGGDGSGDSLGGGYASRSSGSITERSAVGADGQHVHDGATACLGAEVGTNNDEPNCSATAKLETEPDHEPRRLSLPRSWQRHSLPSTGCGSI